MSTHYPLKHSFLTNYNMLRETKRFKRIPLSPKQWSTQQQQQKSAAREGGSRLPVSTAPTNDANTVNDTFTFILHSLPLSNHHSPRILPRHYPHHLFPSIRNNLLLNAFRLSCTSLHS